MAVTSIRDASDVNVLLDHLLGRARTGAGAPPSADQVRDAAVRLADAAHAKLQTGVRGSNVLAAWPCGTDIPAMPGNS
jgi:hypothetical protein